MSSKSNGKHSIRSVRLSDADAQMLARLVELDKRRSERLLMRPRREGSILADAITTGLDRLLVVWLLEQEAPRDRQ